MFANCFYEAGHRIQIYDMNSGCGRDPIKVLLRTLPHMQTFKFATKHKLTEDYLYGVMFANKYFEQYQTIDVLGAAEINICFAMFLYGMAHGTSAVVEASSLGNADNVDNADQAATSQKNTFRTACPTACPTDKFNVIYCAPSIDAVRSSAANLATHGRILVRVRCADAPGFFSDLTRYFSTVTALYIPYTKNKIMYLIAQYPHSGTVPKPLNKAATSHGIIIEEVQNRDVAESDVVSAWLDWQHAQNLD